MAQGTIEFTDLELPDFPVLGNLDNILPNINPGTLGDVPDNYSENMDFSTEGTQTPRIGGSTGSGSIASIGGLSGVSSNESRHWQGGFAGLGHPFPPPQQSVNPLGVGALAQISVEQALFMNIARTESEIRKISQERDLSQTELIHTQRRLTALLQEKAAMEEKVRNYEVLVRTMGQSAFQQALQHIREAFDQAPIPRGIRFAPTDYEVFEYLARKIRGTQEDVGLDRFLVRRLRGMQDSDSLIPEVELLKYPRPWHLPGLDVAPDGKGQVGFYFVRPEWRPNERRRRREADMAQSDPKPPCWKESCQPTTFEDLVSEYGGRPERRMFRFKLPGAREGPAGEKEKWKMYEYTLKSDAEMYDDRRNGQSVWVICKVMREGPMTMEEQEERARGLAGGRGGGGPGPSNGGTFLDPGNGGSQFGSGFGGSGGKLGGYDGPSTSGNTGSGSLGGGGAYGAGSQGGGQYMRSHAGTQEGGGERQQTSGSSDKETPGTSGRKTMTSTSGTTSGTDGTAMKGAGGVSSTGARMPIGADLAGWLKSVPMAVPPRSGRRRTQKTDPRLEDSSKPWSGSRSGSGSGSPQSGSVSSGTASPPLGDSSWLPPLCNMSKVAARLLEDFFVGKLAAKVRAEQDGGQDSRGISPPSWGRALPEEYWDGEADSESDWEVLPTQADEDGREEELEPGASRDKGEEAKGTEEEEEEEEEGKLGQYEEEEEEEVESFTPRRGSVLDALARQVLTDVNDLTAAVAEVPVAREISAQLAMFLTQLEAVVREFMEQAGRDEPAAQLWLESLQEGLDRVRGLGDGLGEKFQSRLLLLVKSPEMAREAQLAVRRLAHILSLLPAVHLDGMSASVQSQLVELTAAMAKAEFVPEARTLEAVSKLQLALQDCRGRGEEKEPKKGSGEALSDCRDPGPADEISQLKALNQLEVLMLEFSTKKGLDLGPPSRVNNLMVEVFALVGVEWDRAAVSAELEQLEKGKAERKGSSKGRASKPSEDAALTEGVIALLKACSLDSLDTPPSSPTKGSTSGKSKERREEPCQVACDPLPEAPLVYSCCRRLTEAEVGSLVRGSGQAEINGLARGFLEGRPVGLYTLKQGAAVEREFHREVERLAAIRHPNVVSLIGCCPEARCLVYQDPPSSSLEEFFYNPGSLLPSLGVHIMWYSRVRIMLEVASALSFLHSQKPSPIIHRNLRPETIWLRLEPVTKYLAAPAWWPSRQGGEGKKRVASQLGLVGVRALLPLNIHLMDMRKDGVYMDPQFARSGEPYVPATDVYALGVVMMMLLAGRQGTAATSAIASAFPKKGEAVKVRLEVVLDVTAGKWPLEETRELAEVALGCTAYEREKRPDLTAQVLPLLQKMAALADAAESAALLRA